MSVRVVLPYRAKVIASKIDDFPAPVRPVITVYFSGNRSGGIVFFRDSINPRNSTSSRTKHPLPGVGAPLPNPEDRPSSADHIPWAPPAARRAPRLAASPSGG